MRHFLITAWLLFCLWPVYAHALLTLDDTLTQEKLGTHLSYICDPTNQLTLADIQRYRFTALNAPEVSFGFHHSACWFKFSLHNTSPHTQHVVLSSDFNIFDRIDLYISDGQNYHRQSVGDSVPYSSRDLKIRTLAIPFEVPAGQNQDYYLHAETTGTFYLPFRLSSYLTFIRLDGYYNMLIGLCYGVVIGLFLYHALLLVMTREKVQLIYISYVLCTLLFFMAEQGSLFCLWPNSTFWNNKSVYSFSFLALCAGTLFARIYLNTKYLPRLHAPLKWLAISQGLFAVLHFAIPTTYIAAANSVFGLVMILFLFGVGIKRWLDGLPEARLFIIAWGLLLVIVAAMIIMMHLGMGEISQVLLGAQVAFAAQQVLLSIGLAQRLKTLQQEKDAQEQEMLLAKAESAAKTDFLARMSHEIRTPMNAVMGVGQLLEATPLTPSQQHYMGLLKSSGKLLLNIIDDILDYSKINSGTISLEYVPFDLHQLINSIYEILSAKNEEKPVELTCELSTDLPRWVEGDPTRLRQVLFNLLSNALKFTERGQVSLQAKRLVQIDKDTVQAQITISDTGIGLSKTQIDNLFSAFHQADASITRKYGGTGLGLAISKQLIDLMGGSIHASSKVGEGATFVILLPLRLTAELVTMTNPIPPTLPWQELSQLRVLLTEDNAVNQLILSSLIKQLGIEPQIANNGEEAFALISKNHAAFDLILMDCEMPILDGLGATRKIRAWEQEQHLPPIPIIALTAHALPEYQVRCRDAGMNDYLTKPLLLDELAKRLFALKLLPRSPTQPFPSQHKIEH